MVELNSDIDPCGWFVLHRGADGAALLPRQENVQEGELPI